MEFLQSLHHLGKQTIMKKLLLPIFVVLLFAGFKSIEVKVKTITGVVTDNDDKTPLQGVSVIPLDKKKGTVTDKNGRYTISIPESQNSLRFEDIGYKSVTAKIKGSVLNIVMERSGDALSEVVISDYSESKSETRLSPAPAKTILAGRVSGIAISDSRTARSEVPSGPVTFKKPSPAKDEVVVIRRLPNRERPQSNQLTAGEWNDLENWNFWKDLMNNQDWSNKQSHWEFYTKNRVSISLKNKQQKPLNNYQITATSNGQPIWKAMSNYAGKAELWPSLYNNENEGIAISVSDKNGNIVFKRNFSQNVRNVNITIDRPQERIKNLDVMFMVDATGSMGDEIDYLKSELEDIIGRLDTDNDINTRTGLVFYRDRGDEYIVRDFGFDSNLMNVKRNLSKQFASGGGDFEEAVEEAMENAIYQQRWTTEGNSTKLMFMILDAPPHHDAAKVKSLQRSVKEAAAKGIALIPVVASGIDKNTEFLMRFMALSTNGTYVFLTDDSSIGNSHLKPTVGNYKVEHLNKLLSRLITKYAGLKSNVAEDLLSSAQN